MMNNLTPAYGRIKSVHGKFYIPMVRQPLHKFPRPLHRAFKTATQALDYSRGIIDRYAALKAAYMPEVVIAKRRSVMELLKLWINGIYLKVKKMFGKRG